MLLSYAKFSLTVFVYSWWDCFCNCNFKKFFFQRPIVKSISALFPLLFYICCFFIASFTLRPVSKSILVSDFFLNFAKLNIFVSDIVILSYIRQVIFSATLKNVLLTSKSTFRTDISSSNTL